MNLKILWILVFSLGIIHLGLSQKKIITKGLTSVAPPRAFEGDPFKELKTLGANWTCLVPYGFCGDGDTQLRYNMKRQWWGEKAVGIRECIKMAHNNELSIMLKPQIYMHGSWVGDYDLSSEAEWQKWEKSYRDFMMFYVDIAVELDVEMICIGTEYRIAVIEREKFWRKLIDEIREKYCGKLTYSANWDDYDNVKIWDALDYIGISAYFPLNEEDTPSKEKLLMAWKPIVKTLSKFSKKYDRPLLFTEYGYLSVDGSAGKTWLLEKKVRKLEINEKTQAVALDALYTSFWNQDFWIGGFLWKWFPEGMGHEGYPERDYTPQGKQAEQVIKTWFTQ